MNGLRRQTSRQLHEEHVHVLGLLDKLGAAAARQGAAAPAPAPGDETWGPLLGQLAGALQHEVTRHFDLEEQRLFPLLREHGHGDLAELLHEEHQVIREVARPLLEQLGGARAGTLDAAGWKPLRLLILELVDRLGAHARMEEDALVPVVDEILDEDTDMEIWNAHMN
ncbi:MAG: hemerythrin domain-containing protein [Burkholderiales bacterium]|nr:hemerythrin domain-containing protein [Burkholderiales bacterium]